ncbi:MAG TPA: hypothetical protein VFA65_23805 [Bryobacteraceae bacterium]|nr:hypothetical protein [Bryobacteraceae bacterium]
MATTRALASLERRRKQFGLHVFTETRTQVAPKRYRASRIEAKIDDYLRFGVAHIWLVISTMRSVI